MWRPIIYSLVTVLIWQLILHRLQSCHEPFSTKLSFPPNPKPSSYGQRPDAFLTHVNHPEPNQYNWSAKAHPSHIVHLSLAVRGAELHPTETCSRHWHIRAYQCGQSAGSGSNEELLVRAPSRRMTVLVDVLPILYFFKIAAYAAPASQTVRKQVPQGVRPRTVSVLGRNKWPQRVRHTSIHRDE